MHELLETLNSFAAANRWVFWPAVGALIMVITGIRNTGGLKGLRQANHPVQGVVGMIILGVIIGLAIAWVTKALFH
jgi:hypothetical protein